MKRIHNKDLRVRLTEKEHAQLMKHAEDCGLTTSAYIRKLLHNEPLILRPLDGAVEHFKAMQEFRTEYARIANHLPHDERERIDSLLEMLLRQSRQLI